MRPARSALDRGEDTAATAHGALRHLSGFNLLQLGAEYRALRASVIKLWRAHLSKEHHGALDDLTRFNESVDQALAESIASYADELARSRDTFLAILGHDLRSPLSAVVDVGTLPFHGGDARRQAGIAGRGAHPARRREDGRHDQGPPGIHRERGSGAGSRSCGRACDIGRLCEAAIEEMRSGHPERVFRFATSGELGGAFDGARLEQVFANLLNNAVQHGAKGSPVILEAHGRPRRDQRAGEELWPGDSGRRAAGDLQSPGPGPAQRRGPDEPPLHQPRPGPFHRAPASSLGHGGTLEVESSDARRDRLHRPPSQDPEVMAALKARAARGR